MSHNNYDKSSTGTDIECVCYYDTDESQRLFNESIKILQHSSYSKSCIAYYVDYGNVPDAEEITFTLKATLEQKTALLQKEGYTLDSDLPPQEDMTDYILDMYGEKLSILNYQDASNVFAPMTIEPSKPIEKIAIHGYSQGDYATVYYCPDDLEKAWGNKPDANDLKETFTHLFYDAPIYARFEINGVEYPYFECPEYSDYEWKRDEFLAYVAKESGVPIETLAPFCPETPDYI